MCGVFFYVAGNIKNIFPLLYHACAVNINNKLGGFTFLLFSLAIKAKLDNFSCDFIQSSSDSMCSCIIGFVFIMIMILPAAEVPLGN